MYSYYELLKDCEEFIRLGYRVEYIGKTVYGIRIPAILRGEKPDFLIVGGTHARENVTSKLVSHLAKEYEGDKICFLPLLNIDGTEIVRNGIKSVPREYRNLVERLKPNDGFSLWKANGRGVDINVNYDADWGKGISNRFEPWYENYVGEFPESEPETKASADLVRKYRFSTLITYHAKGEVIYHRYKGVGCDSNAQMLAYLTGYALEEVRGSVGGFKDWFIQERYGDGYTVEVGADCFEHPLPEYIYPEIYEQNKDLCSLLEDKEWKYTKNS